MTTYAALPFFEDTTVAISSHCSAVKAMFARLWTSTKSLIWSALNALVSEAVFGAMSVSEDICRSVMRSREQEKIGWS